MNSPEIVKYGIGAEVDEDLDASLGNLLRQALEREKKLKEDVKRANERES